MPFSGTASVVVSRHWKHPVSGRTVKIALLR
jgi:hypothetical protein